MRKNTSKDLPNCITSRISSDAVRDLLIIVNGIDDPKLVDPTEGVNNLKLFDAIQDIVDYVTLFCVTPQYPNTQVLLMKDVVTKITCNAEEYFIPSANFVRYEDGTIESYSILIDLNEDVLDKDNVLMFRNCSTSSYQRPKDDKFTGDKIFLKANLLVSRISSILDKFPLIIKFSDSNNIHLLIRGLIEKHPGSLFDLKYNFNNKSSNVMWMVDMNYADFGVVVKAMMGDLVVFSENEELMDYLGLTVNHFIKATVRGIISDINNVNKQCEQQICDAKIECEKKIKQIGDDYRNCTNDLISFASQDGPECVFVSNEELYSYSKNFFKTNANVVPIQISYTNFDFTGDEDEDYGKGSVLDNINQYRRLLNFSVLDGAPVFIDFCSKDTYPVCLCNYKLTKINSYNSLRRKALDQIFEPRHNINLDWINFSGNAKQYIETLTDMCDVSVQLSLGLEEVNRYKNHYEYEDVPLDVELLKKIYGKIDKLKIFPYESYFKKYIQESQVKPTIETIISTNYNPGGHNANDHYNITIKSYFGFLRLE